MKVIDKLTSRLFDLPSGFKISFDKSNPFLTAQGTISLPIVFPYTDTNVGILDNPIRYDRAEKLTIKRKVIIQAGLYQREATLAFTGGKRPTSFSAGYLNGTFLLDEAVFYNQMKDVTMQSVFSTIVRDHFTGTHTEKIAAWVDYLETVMTGEVSDDFNIFPVAYEVDTAGTGTPLVYHHGFLNHVTQHHIGVSGTGVEYYHLSGRYARTYLIDEANVDIPVGYEITPFLKKSYILGTLFSKFGYVLNPDYMTKYPELAKAVELNNTADSLMLGFIDYGQLVPSKTITEYLNSIRYSYGCEFFLAENGIDVNLVFWNDVLTNDVDIDLSKLIMDAPVVNYESAKTVQLTQSYTNKLDAVKSLSYKQLITSFDNIPLIYYTVLPDYQADPQSFVESIAFSQKTLHFYHVWNQRAADNEFDPVVSDMGQNLYDCYADDNVTAMPFANTAEAVPMVQVGMGETKDLVPIWDYVDGQVPYSIPYVGPVRTPNTSIIINAKSISNTQVECPIMSCFHYGRMLSTNQRLFWGTTHRYDDSGTPWGNLNLVYNGPNGLFEKFWKKFDDVLRNSWQPMIFPVNLSIYQGLHWDPSKQKMLNGQPLVCEVLKYELSDAGVNVTEADFRTTKLYTDPG